MTDPLPFGHFPGEEKWEVLHQEEMVCILRHILDLLNEKARRHITAKGDEISVGHRSLNVIKVPLLKISFWYGSLTRDYDIWIKEDGILYYERQYHSIPSWKLDGKLRKGVMLADPQCFEKLVIDLDL